MGFTRTLLLTSAVILLTACANAPTAPSWEEAKSYPLIAMNYAAADALLGQVAGKLNKTQPLLVATVVNIDNLDQSSTLGRAISEHISARLTQTGYRMIEMKYRNSVYIKRNQGELMLTREVKELAQAHDAQAVIVGSYARSDSFVFINLKIIQPATSVIMAAHDYTLPLDWQIKGMLR